MPGTGPDKINADFLASDIQMCYKTVLCFVRRAPGSLIGAREAFSGL